MKKPSINKEKLKKSISETEKNLIKGKIDNEKETLRRYIKVLTEYDFVDTASSKVYFGERYRGLLKAGFKEIASSNLPEKRKEELSKELIGFFRNHKVKETLEEANLRYYKKLVAWAKFTIERFPQELKEKVVKDAIKKQELWSKQFSVNSKIYEEIHNAKKKKQATKKKVAKRKTNKKHKGIKK